MMNICNFNSTIFMKDELFLSRINLTKTFCVYQASRSVHMTNIDSKQNNQCTVEKKRCFQSYNRGYKRSGKN